MVAERLGIGVLEKEEVVDFLAGGFVETNGIHLFAIGGGVGDPDLVAHDYGGRPGATGDRSFPNDVFVFAPFGGEAVGFSFRGNRVVTVICWAAEGGPISLAGESQAEKKESSNEHEGESVIWRFGIKGEVCLSNGRNCQE